MSFAYYESIELLPNGAMTSCVRSQSPYVVFADALMKVRKPITGHYNLRKSISDVRISITPVSVEYDSPSMFNIILKIVDAESGDLLCVQQIETKIIDEPIEMGLCHGSAQAYCDIGYLRGVESLKRRILSWCDGDILVGRALFCHVASDPDHLFWRQSVSEEF